MSTREERRRIRMIEAKKAISAAAFEPTIVINFNHHYKVGMLSWSRNDESEWITTNNFIKTHSTKYLISDNLLCLPIYGELDNGYPLNIDDYETGLDYLMHRELSIGEFDDINDYKLELKQKARSNADKEYGHAKIYIEYQSNPIRTNVDYESILNNSKFEQYWNQHNAIDCERIDKGRTYHDTVIYNGKALRAASKQELETLYAIILKNADGVGDIVNTIFQLLNIAWVLPKLKIGNLSKEIKKQQKKIQRKEANIVSKQIKQSNNIKSKSKSKSKGRTKTIRKKSKNIFKDGDENSVDCDDCEPPPAKKKRMK